MKISYSLVEYMNEFKRKYKSSYVLMSNKEISLLKSIFAKVFDDKDPFKDSFKPSIESKIIICPTDGYALTKNQFEAFCEVAKGLGHDNFYLSVIEIENFNESEHFILDTSLEYSEYLKLPIIMENAIYTPNGELGILISHELHGILGGNKEAVRRFKDSYNYSNADIDNFLDMWVYNKENYKSEISWVYDLIDKFY